MIDAKELRIGNYVLVNGALTEVKSIYPFYINGGIHDDGSHIPLSECEPIPLTEEILLKCGFEKKDDKWYNLKFKISDCESNEMYFGGLESDICLFTERYFSSNSVKYLHQLQNLYFAITGKEIDVSK